MLKPCAVIGQPVDHSLSPAIHQAFAAQFGETLEYSKLEVAEEDFESAVNNFFKGGGLGMNVTLPFKERAFRMVQKFDELAEMAGAVNTLYLRCEILCGTNTDGVGLVRDLRQTLHQPLDGMQVLILGAGGAARGIVGPLLQAGVAGITVANRTPARAQQVVDWISQHGGEGQPLMARAFDKLVELSPDLIINASSAGIDNKYPEIPADKVNGAICYDLLYGPAAIPFCQWAGQQGARQVSDGLGMLVRQAAESFQLWHGLKPQVTPVVEALRAEPLPGLCRDPTEKPLQHRRNQK